MAQVVSHVYQLKRGKVDILEERNPMLLYGEPIVAYFPDGNIKLKIGDGVHNYRELPFIGGDNSSQEICNFPTRQDFPNVGNSNFLYKAENEATLYQWNSRKTVYELLCVDEVNVDITDIEFISGGVATDLVNT